MRRRREGLSYVKNGANCHFLLLGQVYAGCCLDIGIFYVKRGEAVGGGWGAAGCLRISLGLSSS